MIRADRDGMLMLPQQLCEELVNWWLGRWDCFTFFGKREINIRDKEFLDQIKLHFNAELDLESLQAARTRMLQTAIHTMSIFGGDPFDLQETTAMSPKANCITSERVKDRYLGCIRKWSSWHQWQMRIFWLCRFSVGKQKKKEQHHNRCYQSGKEG